jgi:hypothetical protein
MFWKIFEILSSNWFGEKKLTIESPLSESDFAARLSAFSECKSLWKTMLCSPEDDQCYYFDGRLFAMTQADKRWLFGINRLACYFLIGKIHFSHTGTSMRLIFSVNIIAKIFFLSISCIMFFIAFMMMIPEIFSGRIFTIEGILFIIIIVGFLYIMRLFFVIISKVYQFWQRHNIKILRQNLELLTT